MANIQVQHLGGTQFQVEVREGASSTVHTVTVDSHALQRYGADSSAVLLLEKSFEFLLEREPKESILRTFDLPVIEQYFPDFPKTISSRLA